jgi:hypothetical protein
MIEIFKTNVETADDACTIVQQLLVHFPGSRINFDLQDCDRILRVEGKTFSVDQVMMLVCQNGFNCEILN